jgi:site-specific DNA recombinase
MYNHIYYNDKKENEALNFSDIPSFLRQSNKVVQKQGGAMYKDAVIYCRVSTERQVTEGSGLATQEHACNQYAKQHKLNVLKVFRDDGVSGAKSDRKGLNAMFEYINTHKLRCYVVADDLARIARDIEVYRAMTRKIEEYQCALRFVKMQASDGSANGLMMESVYALFAEHARNENRERVISRMKSRNAMGIFCYGVKMGYEYEDHPAGGRVLQPKGLNADIAKDVLSRYASGEFMSVVEAADYVNMTYGGLVSDRHKTRGNIMYCRRNRVEMLIKNAAFYAGYLEADNGYIKGCHRALITDEQLDAILVRLKKPTGRAPYQRRNDDFYLKQTARCEVCGNLLSHTLSGGRNAKYGYYLCRTPHCSLHGKNISTEKAHANFITLLAELELDPSAIAIIRNIYKGAWDQRYAVYKRNKEDLKRDLAKLARKKDEALQKILQLGNPTVIKALEAQVEQIAFSEARLEKKISDMGIHSKDFESSINDLLKFLSDPIAHWSSGSTATKRSIQRMVFPKGIILTHSSKFRKPEKALLFRLKGFNLARLEKVVVPARFERAANSLGNCCSIHLSYGTTRHQL